MANTYKTLIDLYTHRLDEKRKQIVELEQGADNVQQFLDKLEEDLKHEKQFVARQEAGWNTFEAFFQQNRFKNVQFAKSLATLEEQIQKQYEELNALFYELKRYEILEERRLEEEEAEANRKEQQFLDEVAAVGHQRQGSNE